MVGRWGLSKGANVIPPPSLPFGRRVGGEGPGGRRPDVTAAWSPHPALRATFSQREKEEPAGPVSKNRQFLAEPAGPADNPLMGALPVIGFTVDTRKYRPRSSSPTAPKGRRASRAHNILISLVFYGSNSNPQRDARGNVTLKSTLSLWNSTNRNAKGTAFRCEGPGNAGDSGDRRSPARRALRRRR